MRLVGNALAVQAFGDKRVAFAPHDIDAQKSPSVAKPPGRQVNLFPFVGPLILKS
jgi:hypothetical protein